MNKNFLGNRKLSFGGTVPVASSATRLAELLPNPPQSNALANGGDWASGITSAVKGFLGGYGAAKDVKAQEFYNQQQAQLGRDRYNDLLDRESERKEKEYFLNLLKAGIDPNRIDDPQYLKEVLEQKNFITKAGAQWNTDLANAYRIINDPNSTQEQKEFMRAAIMYNKTPEFTRNLAYNKALGQSEGELVNARELEREKKIGAELLREKEGVLTPIPGSKEDLSRAEKERQRQASFKQTLESAEQMVKNTREALDYLNESPNLRAGAFGYMGFIPFTSQGQLKAMVDTVKSNVGLNKLLEIKQAGGTFGALSEKELEGLENSLGALKTTQHPYVLRRSLENILEKYQKVLNAAKNGDSQAADVLAGSYVLPALNDGSKNAYAQMSDEELIEGL